MKKIKLTKGQFTIVDDDMFDYLNQWKWYLNNDGYAVRSKRVFNGKKHIFMHRLVNNTPDNMQTDHINRDKLDNRNENLRNTTKMLNGRNRGTPKNNTSGYKGVVWDKSRNKWQASIQVEYKNIYLGRYSTLQGAWLARRWGERLYWV